VVIVDEVVSTGATIDALRTLVAQAAGTTVQVAAVATEGNRLPI